MSLELIILWLTLTAYVEAKGEPIECKRAVADVVLNRDAGRGRVDEVIQAPGQFQWVSRMMSGGVLRPEYRPLRNTQAWRDSEKAALQSLYGVRTTAMRFKAHYSTEVWDQKTFLFACGKQDFYTFAKE